jgi:holo-[acyl-carrier protein] synthase
MIIGTGLDIMEVRRVDALLRKAGDRFLRRWFTDEEVAYCLSRARPAEHLAARLAAKEACVKALRLAVGDGLLLRDIAVIREDEGAPSLRLAGRAADIASRAGVDHLFVSLTHTREYAAASVVAVGEITPRPRGS